MVIWLLRHGDAEDGDGKPDADRDLTEKGERQSVDAGQALKKLGVELDVCLTSPKVRAKRTADLACDALDCPVEEDDRLAGGDFDPLELAARPRRGDAGRPRAGLLRAPSPWSPAHG